ncbi:MAG TPA: hypothetical protein VF405_02395 [Gammaproteobacteria bacterium]
MLDLLTFLEDNRLSVFIREWPSVFGFPTILFLHTLGLAMVAGVSIAIDIWILRGARAGAPLHLLGLTRTMWLGFGINLVSGLALLLAYPAKALTNSVFYLKMTLVLLGVYVAVRINREIAARGGGAAVLTGTFDARRWAVVSLSLWAAATVTGRLLAYTYNVLFAYELAR